jgi:alkanesulfonate monooxygenase SsuD/methylene tetrahydromethanopterin reductase-like flavin-dependent oxidoreductase (luciferase family)
VPQLIGRGTFVPDPFVTLTVAATVTEGVELGTATVQVPLHHPAVLAHRILSLQLVCGDRLTVALSPGSTDTDFAVLDRDYGARFTTFRQNVARLRVLLADGRDEPADLAPVDAISGRPPLLLGSWGANVERAAQEFDGWLAACHRRTPKATVRAIGLRHQPQQLAGNDLQRAAITLCSARAREHR